MNNPQTDQILMNVVEHIKENIDLFKSPCHLETVLDEELDSRLKNGNHIKDISQSSIRTSLSNEILSSSGYTRCVPVIIRDNLNDYSIHLHVDANTNGLSHNQMDVLNYLPLGILNMYVIKGKRFFTSIDNISSMIQNIRKDIVNVEPIVLPKSNNRYNVSYIPKTDEVYIKIDGEKCAYKATGLDLKLTEKMPELKFLADHYRMNIANTFFM